MHAFSVSCKRKPHARVSFEAEKASWDFTSIERFERFSFFHFVASAIFKRRRGGEKTAFGDDSLGSAPSSEDTTTERKPFGDRLRSSEVTRGQLRLARSFLRSVEEARGEPIGLFHSFKAESYRHRISRRATRHAACMRAEFVIPSAKWKTRYGVCSPFEEEGDPLRGGRRSSTRRKAILRIDSTLFSVTLCPQAASLECLCLQRGQKPVTPGNKLHSLCVFLYPHCLSAQ